MLIFRILYGKIPTFQKLYVLSIFQKNLKHTRLLLNHRLSSDVAYENSYTKVPVFYERACAHVRSTFHYRTISGFQNPSQILRLISSLGKCLPHLRIACNIESSAHPLLRLVTHLILLTTILRDREMWRRFVKPTRIRYIPLRLIGYDKAAHQHFMNRIL